MIESMACGTPVIAFESLTGFIVEDQSVPEVIDGQAQCSTSTAS
jgi:hypothetical protein